MKLLLTSQGLTNQSIVNALGDLIGKPFSQSNIAFISTAAALGTSDKSWLVRNLVDCKNAGFGFFDIVDFSAIPEISWRPRLEKADVLFFCGGDSSHLMYQLKKTGLIQLLPKLLETKVYVGISAATIVATKDLRFVSNGKREEAKKVDDYSGEDSLAYVNFYIRPHFNDPNFPQASREYIEQLTQQVKEPVYAIDDQTAISVDGSEIKIISEGKWEKFN